MFRLSNGKVFYYVEDENLRDELKNPKTRPYKVRNAYTVIFPVLL